MKNTPTTPSRYTTGFYTLLLLLGVLALLFWRSFLPDYVHFSNDGPLGQQNVDWLKLPAAMTGMWVDLNDVGFASGTFTPGITALIKFALGPVGYAKFYPAIALFILGLGAWAFFRALKLSTLATVLGALAAMLSSNFLAGACWGVASVEIAMGFNFLALALVVANTAGTPRLTRWTRLALAGFCVGINVIEAADVGALCSMTVAVFVFYKSLAEAEGGVVQKISRGIGRVAVVAVFAGFLATQTIVALVTTQIQGIAGTAQDAETKTANWDHATQWSLPKMETLGLVVPGLFGYKMDTPNNMMPQFQKSFEGGIYWGGMGRAPENDRYFDSGGQGSPPSSWMRQTGGGDYCGILVALIAAWAIAQSFRRQKSQFSASQKNFIWFWGAALLLSLLFAWGRFGFLDGYPYRWLYGLPYASTVRNPAKFTIIFCWALITLFAYGIHALSQRQLNRTAAKTADATTQLKNWWARADGFDRKWTHVCLGILGASILGWLVFSAENNTFLAYLHKVGFPDEAFAKQIAAFSLGQLVWFIGLLAVALGLVTLVIAGYFSGPRARLGGGLLGAFLIFDLGRADLPYIIHWDYKQKYEVGTLNPVVSFLTQKPYEHRVAGLPFEPQQPLRGYNNTFGGSGIYRIEWMQHHFPYYNIQCLDIIQMPRMPEDLKAYLEALSPRSQAQIALYARHWELTNTRYLLGAAGFLDVLNQLLDPVQHRFRIAQRFDIVNKPGITRPNRFEELTAAASPDGDLALFEFTGALPRAKLYSNWQVNTNDQANLKTLADPNFNPAETVLISTPQKNLPAVATNKNSGTVEFKSYSPKRIVFDANATAPSVLLLNDKYDPNWRVTVDGQPAELLRCNYLMRGVGLPAGPHTVEFDFSLPNKPLYVTLAAMATGVCLCAVLGFLTRRNQADKN
jgi:hypothetical protein